MITAEGTALFWVYDPIPYDLTALGGPADGVLHDGVIQEIDIATGQRLFEWRARDHVALDESYAPLPQGDSAHLPYDYFHANSVGLDADGQPDRLGPAHLDRYKINRQTGEVIWRLGGKKSDFTVGRAGRASPGSTTSGGAGTARYSIFDNGAGVTKEQRPLPRPGLQARRGGQDGHVRRRSSCTRDKLSAPTQGNFRELADGGSFIGWGQMPHFTEHAADGTVRLAGHLPLDNQSYRAYKAEWTGEPLDQPALGLRVEGGNVVVSASWNGATKVAQVAGPGGRPARGAAGGRRRSAAPASRRTLTIPGTPEYVVAEPWTPPARCSAPRQPSRSASDGNRRVPASEPATGLAAQGCAAGEGDAGGQEGGVDQGERADEPDRPLWCDGQHHAGQGDHRAVVADQLDHADRQRRAGHHAGRLGAGLHHRGDQVDHPGAGEGGQQPGRGLRHLRLGGRGQRRHQGDLRRHVAQHVDPAAGRAGLAGHPGQLAVGAVQRVRELPADQREQARPARPRSGRRRPGRRPRPPTNDTRQPRPRLATVSTVGASLCLWAKTAIRAPRRWLTASLNRPPPRLTA